VSRAIIALALLVVAAAALEIGGAARLAQPVANCGWCHL
jgi:hypothetical protein